MNPVGVVARLSARELSDVIEGRTRLGDTQDEQLAVWNAAIDRENGYSDHDCHDNAVPYSSDGPLGHGWECGICGAFLQAG